MQDSHGDHAEKIRRHRLAILENSMTRLANSPITFVLTSLLTLSLGLATPALNVEVFFVPWV